LPRLALQTPVPLTKDPATDNAVFPAALGERPAKRLSYHTDFSANPTDPAFRNLISGRGPIEGRPPGEIFAHQRWILPQDRLRNLARPDCAQQQIPSQFPGATSKQRLVLRHRPQRAGTPAADAVQGTLWRTDPDPRLQQPAGAALRQ
jgi:hypothetical protein